MKILAVFNWITEQTKGTGGSAMRAVFALAAWFIVILLSLVAGVLWSDAHPILWGVVFWAISMTFLTTPFLVSVPEVTGLLTVNVFSGELRPYGTGIHFRFPWEQVKKKNFINMRKVIERWEEDYPSKSGPMMHIKWQYEYQPLLAYLEQYINVKKEDIDKGLRGGGGSVLSVQIKNRSAEKCKENHEQIEKDLVKTFENMDPTPAQLYGVDLIRVAMEDMDYEKKYQDARTTEAVTKKLRQIAKDIKKDHTKISDKDSMNTALIVNGNVTKTVTEVEGQAGEAIAALIIAASKGAK